VICGARSRPVGAVVAVSVLAGCGESVRTPTPVATVARTCDAHHTGVGYGGVSAYAQSQALRVGPISLGSLGTLTLASLDRVRAGPTRFWALESIAVVKAGASVTVAVPAPERSYVALIYDKNKFRDDGAYRIRDLDWVVRFQACKDAHFNHGVSQYDGGVVVARRRCFMLDFYIQGRRGKIERRIPSRGRCPRGRG
jgi:hypothetical protein